MPGSSWAIDEPALLRLWREKRGETEPANLFVNRYQFSLVE